MPNAENIHAPVVIVGAGRSGTSVLSAVFEDHPDFIFGGEVANLIFGIWHSVEISLNSMPEFHLENRLALPEERASQAVRAAFLTLCPSPHAYWCIKPIGIPKALTEKFQKLEEWDEAAEYYWKVLQLTFPRARFVTVLRHPCDVVLSSASRWGHDPVTLWWSLGFMAHILSHKSAPPLHAISFEALVGDSETVVRNLFAALNLPFHPELMASFQKQHATSRDLNEVRTRKGSRKDQWQMLLPQDLSPLYRRTIDRLYRHCGQPAVKWPPHLKHRTTSGTQAATKSAAAEPATPEAEIARLNSVTISLNREIEKINERFGSKLLEQQREFDVVWRNQESKIIELHKALDWQQSQNGKLTADHAAAMATITDLTAWNAKLAEAKDWQAQQNATLATALADSQAKFNEAKNWFDSQAAATATERTALHQQLAELRGWNAKLSEAKDWQAEQNATLASALEASQVRFNETKNWFDSQAASLATERDALHQQLAELRGWNAKLIEAKDWQASQNTALATTLEGSQARFNEAQNWFDSQAATIAAERDALHQQLAELRGWNAKLAEAKDWQAEQNKSLLDRLHEADVVFGVQQERIASLEALHAKSDT